jgi:hypothetical protein
MIKLLKMHSVNYYIDFNTKTIQIVSHIDVVTISNILNDIANYERIKEERYQWEFVTEKLPIDTTKRR